MARFMLTKSIISLRFYRTSLALILGVVLAVGASSALAAAAPTPGAALGDAFVVNVRTTGKQRASSIASDAAGDFVLAWTDWSGKDGDDRGIFARRYLADGTPEGSEFQVNTHTTGLQRAASVAMDAAGRFVIVWADQNTGQINRRLYDTDGSALKNSDQKVADSGKNPDVAMDASGNFIVAYQNGAWVYFVKYDANGNEKARKQLAKGSNAGVAMSAKGNFIVVYEKDSNTIKARVKESNGNLIKKITISASDLSVPDVAMSAAGKIVIVWKKLISTGGAGGFDTDIYAQRYDAAGVMVGNSARINTTTTGTQSYPAVAMDTVGNYVVTWSDASGQDGDLGGVMAQRYDQSGQTVGPEFVANTKTLGSQGLGSVAMDASGGIMVAWTDFNGLDGDETGIIAQRYARMSPVNLKTILDFPTGGTVKPGERFSLFAFVKNREAASSPTSSGDINGALNNATGLKMTVPLPAGVTSVSTIGNDWSCSNAASQLDCTYSKPIKADDLTSPLHINMKAPSSKGVLSFEGTTYGDQPDSDTNNNTGKIDVTVKSKSGSGSSGGGGGGGGGAFGWLGLGFLGMLAALRRRNGLAGKRR